MTNGSGNAIRMRRYPPVLLSREIVKSVIDSVARLSLAQTVIAVARAFWLLAAWGLLIGGACVCTAQEAKPAAAEAEPTKRMGRIMRLGLPITGQTLDRVRRFVRRASEQAESERSRLVLIFEFHVAANQAEFGRGTEFGDAYDLARFISSEEVNKFTTVAYLPQTIQGHAVLAAIACDEIVMAPEAEIGSAGIDERQIEPVLRDAYRHVANRRRTVPVEVALKMLDPNQKVLKVDTEAGVQYVGPRELEELRKKHTIKSQQELLPAGRAGQFTAAEARQIFVKQVVQSRRDVAKALDLPPEAMFEDAVLGDAWRAARIDLKGPVRRETIDQAERIIREEVQKNDVNFLCLWIESPGGSPEDSLRLATFLAMDLPEVRTVAYVPQEARADAALVAMACDQIVIGPRAVLGGWGEAKFTRESTRLIAQTIRQELAPRKSRCWSLPVAMIDPQLEVFRCRSPWGDQEFFSAEELEEQVAPERWQKGTRVTKQGEPFQAVGQDAVDYRLANRVADNLQQLKQYYGLQDDPALLEPTWADFLIEALASPAVAGLLLTIGFVALYGELQMPGVGVGGFVAAVCFMLFFWSRFLGGTAGWLEVILFLCGIAFLALEIFVIPGFGIFGLGGGTMVLASLVLASQTFVFPQNSYQFAQLERSLWILAGAAIGVVILGMFLRRYLPATPVFGHMVLQPPSNEEAEEIRQRESLLVADDLTGARGVATTPLVPGGKARFGERLLDVVAEGEIIARGTEVVVVEVHGSRIVVQPVS